MKTFLPLLLTSASLQAAEPVELKLWPDGVPGKMVPPSKATEDFIRTKAGKSTITDIHDPTITVYRPEKPNGTSVIVAPGGGFVFLSAVHEGTQVCEWLNTLGVTGILLKYRTPTRDEAAPHEKPVQDAAKAIALVREHAAGWKLKPDRVGLLGFSAGGNLLAHIACDRPAASHMPDFGINIYGGGFVDSKDPTKFKEGFSVPADAPPMFMACAHDDGQNPFALTALYLEYKKHKIPAELHMFTKGGHGFGMRDNKQPINGWPQRCAEWMKDMGGFRTVGMLKKGIKQRQAQVDQMAKLLENDFRCGWDPRPDIKARMVKTKAEGNEDEARDLETKLNELNKWVEDALKRAEKVETLAESINRLKKEKIELEVELQSLLEAQHKPRTP